MNELHIAISRVAIGEICEIGPGMRLEPSYAHVFAHPILAVKPPPEPSSHHPAPWIAVKQSGHVETARVQLSLEAETKAQCDAALYRARSVIALLRLISGSPIRAPVWSDICFTEIANAEARANVHQFEPPLLWAMEDFRLTPDVMAVLATLLIRLDERREDDNFTAAFGLLDSVWWIPTLSAQMIAIWSSAEILVQPSRTRMTKELARLIRIVLGTDRSEGDRIFNEVIRLCAARGAAAHAGSEPNPMDVQASYHIARNLMIRSLARDSGILLPLEY